MKLNGTPPLLGSPGWLGVSPGASFLYSARFTSKPSKTSQGYAWLAWSVRAGHEAVKPHEELIVVLVEGVYLFLGNLG